MDILSSKTGINLPPKIELAKKGDDKIVSLADLKNASKLRGASFVKQAFFCHNRSIIQQLREIKGFFVEIGLGAFTGFVLGLLILNYRGELYKGVYISPYTTLTTLPVEHVVPLGAFICGIAVAFTSSVPGVRIFSNEKPMFWREASSRHNRLSYFVGKSVSSFYRIALSALHFSVVFHAVVLPQIDFGEFYLIICGSFLAVYGICVLISMIASKENAFLMAAVTSLFVSVLCGYGPSMKQVKEWNLEWLWGCSFNRWFAEAWFNQELTPYRHVYLVEEISYKSRGYNIDSFALDAGMIYICALGYWTVASIMMVSMNRDKQR